MKLAFEIGGLVGGIATFLALMLGPMFYLGAKIDNFKTEIRQDMNSFRVEMKDFHGRICVIEERNRK